MSKRPRVSRGSLWSRLAMWAVGLGGVCGASAGYAYHHYIVSQPGEHLSSDYIYSVIDQESPVFYSDQKTRIGVFFEDEHRNFVAFDRLPQAYVSSIVAAEDSRFWSHWGFDIRHIARAMRDNLIAGRLVAGGSTLTQQTAKNIYYRPDRSLRSKLIEAVNALRLEEQYEKTDILTFYANQFHVSGNGRGIGIAARHFFDKPVEDLTVLESAFLAGLVKAPSYYDPFLGGQARRERALAKAKSRTRYVLRRLTEVPAEQLAGPRPDGDDAQATEDYAYRVAKTRRVQREAEALLEEGFDACVPDSPAATPCGLDFRRGTFRFDTSAVLDEVARRLSAPPFDEVLSANGIDDPATAGLRVITTLDVDAQRAAVYGLWHHLTEVGTHLEEITLDAYRLPQSRSPRYQPARAYHAGDFSTATVSKEVTVNGRRELVIDLGGTLCRVDRDAIVRVAAAIERGRTADPRAKVSTAKVNQVVNELTPGSVVWASVKSIEPRMLCDLEVRPELQGAVVLTQRGEIRAMVGGNDNKNFNRTTARRQMGSAWKIPVFHAALSLGWDAAEPLDNRDAVFPFSTTLYHPRADHKAPAEVSLTWAGVKSENLASVWLLYHLTDRLPFAEVEQLAQTLDLARREGEDEKAYEVRIQRAGVLPRPSRVREAHYLSARHEVLEDQGEQLPEGDALNLRSLLYGYGFSSARRKADSHTKKLLDRNWKALSARAESCRDQGARLWDAYERRASSVSEVANLRLTPTSNGWKIHCGGQAQPSSISPNEFLEGLVEADGGEVRAGYGSTISLLGLPWMLVDEELHLSTIDRVSDAIVRRQTQRELLGEEAPGLYDPELLYWHQDFRVLMSLRYLTSMVHGYGVQSPLDNVLSLPLGAAELTLEELTLLYEGVVSGKRWEFPGQGPDRAYGAPPRTTLLISEIQDVDGRVLYRARPQGEERTSQDVARRTYKVMEDVVEWGTGRRAKGAVEIAGAPWPLAGKTGTTNGFKNAAFAGVIPGWKDDELSLDDAYALGVYVGYDDNRSMRKGGHTLAGASGALPAWVSVVQQMSEAGQVGAASREEAPEWGWQVPRPDTLQSAWLQPQTGGSLAAEFPSEEVPEGLAETWVLYAAEPASEDSVIHLEEEDVSFEVPLEEAEVIGEVRARRGVWSPRRPKQRRLEREQ